MGDGSISRDKRSARGNTTRQAVKNSPPATEALIEAEQRYRSLVETAPNVILFLDPDGLILEFNSEAERIYGCTRESVLGKNYLGLFIAEEDREKVLTDIRKVLKGQKTRGFENYVQCADGVERLLSWNVNRVLDEHCQARGIIAIGQDITDQHNAERQLRRLAHELQERIKELNCLYRFSELIEQHEPALEKIFQGTCELMQQSWQFAEVTCVRILWEDREFHTANFKASPWMQTSAINVRGEVVGRVELGYLEQRPPADEGPFLREERHLLEAVAHRLGRVVERLRAQTALQRAEEEATTREQQRIGQELHDELGQELTGLGYLAEGLYSDLQKRGLKEAETADKVAMGLQQALKRVRSMTRDLVGYDVRTLGLEAALRQLVTSVQDRWNVACRLRCPHGVTIEDHGVATQLYRIAQEAVTNAAKHAQARQIKVELEQRDRRVTVRVRDDGIGISPASDSGGGMGLRIMKARAERIAAGLRIAPARNGGTVVECVLQQGEQHGHYACGSEHPSGVSDPDRR
jgi:PAS domain S-box-containing protein